MKKRLFCLVLCLLLVLPVVLASCGKKTDEEAMDDITEAASDSTSTVSMWMVTEQPLSDATVSAVSKALTSITESKFQTRLLLTFVTRDVYEQKLIEEIGKFEEVNADRLGDILGGSSGEESTDDKLPETVTNEYGHTVYKYPDKLPHQVDIVYIQSEDMYRTFVKNEWLLSLDKMLDTSAKKLREYVSATLLDAVKEGGATYAIPNNNVIGEYTYMLLNRSMMDKYCYNGYINQNRIDSFFNPYVYHYLETIKKYEDPSFALIDATYEECLGRLAYFWSVDEHSYELLNDFSVFGTNYTDIDSLSRGSTLLGFNSLFEDDNFVEDYVQLNAFRLEGYFTDAADDQPAAVKFVKGDATVAAAYADEYYPIIVEYPTATAGDIFDNMFGVYANSEYAEQSMEIITYLNTNQDFRNILQYGVEDIHYKKTQDAAGNPLVIPKEGSDYKMNVFATGNLFLAYPSEELEISEAVWKNDWKLAKEQNRGSLVSPLLGFDFGFEIDKMTWDDEVVYEIDDTLGFHVSYSTGYTKEVLASNETIKSWLESCDAAESKGVFALKTYETADDIWTYKYYVYNNDVTTDVAFNVLVDEKFNHERDSRNRIVKKLDYLNIGFEYVPVADGGASAYELSVVTLYFDITTPYTEFCKVGEETVEMSVTTMDTLVTVDTMHSDIYDINFQPGLSKIGLADNTVIMSWIDSLSVQKRKQYVLAYADKSGAEKDVYTFITYYSMSNYADLALIPTIVGDDVVIQLVVTESAERVELGDDTDLISLFTVEVAKGVGVSCVNVTNKKTVASANDEEANAFSTATLTTETGAPIAISPKFMTVSETDPDFHSIGTFDHELLKRMNKLNVFVKAQLDACQTTEEFAAVVAELQFLLSTEEEAVTEDFVVLADVVAAEFGGREGLLELFNLVRLGAGMKTVEEIQWDAAGNSFTVKVDLYNPVYSDTPYDIYYNWAKTNGYVPK